MEGTAGDVFLSPLHGQNIISLLLDDVCDVVLLVAHVLHGDLFTGGGWPMDTNQQHVGTWEAKKGGYSVRMHHGRQRKGRGNGSQRKYTNYCLLRFYNDAGTFERWDGMATISRDSEPGGVGSNFCLPLSSWVTLDVELDLALP